MSTTTMASCSKRIPEHRPGTADVTWTLYPLRKDQMDIKLFCWRRGFKSKVLHLFSRRLLPLLLQQALATCFVRKFVPLYVSPSPLVLCPPRINLQVTLFEKATTQVWSLAVAKQHRTALYLHEINHSRPDLPVVLGSVIAIHGVSSVGQLKTPNGCPEGVQFVLAHVYVAALNSTKHSAHCSTSSHPCLNPAFYGKDWRFFCMGLGLMTNIYLSYRTCSPKTQSSLKQRSYSINFRPSTSLLI